MQEIDDFLKRYCFSSQLAASSITLKQPILSPFTLNTAEKNFATNNMILLYLYLVVISEVCEEIDIGSPSVFSKQRSYGVCVCVCGGTGLD